MTEKFITGGMGHLYTLEYIELLTHRHHNAAKNRLYSKINTLVSIYLLNKYQVLSKPGKKVQTLHYTKMLNLRWLLLRYNNKFNM